MTAQGPTNTVPAPIEQALARLGYATPTPVQAAVREAALAGRDVLALAPTGTGKTLAFGVPVLARLLNERPESRRGARGSRFVDPFDRLRALVLSPTRELAQQVAKDLEEVARGSVLRVAVIYGKSPAAPQREAIRGGVDLLVGTPGRVREFLDEGSLSLGLVKMAVVDEADRMTDMGFLPQVEGILSSLAAPRQVICMSATLAGAASDRVPKLMHDPVRVEIGVRNAPAGSVHWRYSIDDREKVALLLGLVKGEKRRGVAVFVRTRRRAGWVAAALARHSVSVALLHGDRSQRSRDAALASFAEGRADVLVATDVASRGLHVSRIETVINYDIPLMPEDFVHRVGRAGHGGGAAESFTFVDAFQREEWRRVSELVGMDIPEGKPVDTTPFAPHSQGRRGKGHASRGVGAMTPLGAPRQQSKKRATGKSTGALWREKKSSRERSKPLARGVKPGKGIRPTRPAPKR